MTVTLTGHDSGNARMTMTVTGTMTADTDNKK